MTRFAQFGGNSDFDDIDTPLLSGAPDEWQWHHGPVVGSPLPAGGDAPSGSFSGTSLLVAVNDGGLTINLLYDAAALAAPASFRAGIEQAAAQLSAAITDHITVNIKIDYSGTGGGAAAGPDNGLYESYSTMRSDLINDASPGDTTFNALPGGSSVRGQSLVAVWNAQLKVLGLMNPNDATSDDGQAIFSTDIDPNLLVGVALHELTHAMGRVPYGSQPDIFDLFRFTSPGNMLFNGSNKAPAAYFSTDGGVTKLAAYGQTSDPSDFLNSGVQGPNDPFNEFYLSTTLQTLTTVDLLQMDALGFHLASNSSPGAFTVSLVQDTGTSSIDHVTSNDALKGTGTPNDTVLLSIDGNSIAGPVTADGSGNWSFTPSGLTEGTHTVVASETDVGGTHSASLTFTLDTLAPVPAITSMAASGNSLVLHGTSDTAGTVSISDGSTLLGSAQVSAGTWNFTISHPSTSVHTFTASQTDIAGNSPGTNVAIYGNTSANTLVGTDGPNLIMGNAGNDTITGGNGNDTIIGGGGGDTLTGGGGIDTFRYTAITDSQHGAGNFDTITDFVHGTDKMDFSAIAGLTSVVVAAGAPGSVAAHTIEVALSGSNTVVYANASGRPESTGSADIEVHVTGVNNLTAGDILHG